MIVKSGRRICGTGAALTNAPLVQDKSYFEFKVQCSGIHTQFRECSITPYVRFVYVLCMSSWHGGTCLHTIGVWGVGVATPSVRLDTVPLGNDQHSWVLTSEGKTLHNGEVIAMLEDKPVEGDMMVRKWWGRKNYSIQLEPLLRYLR